MILMGGLLALPNAMSAATVRSALAATPGGIMIQATPPPETVVYAVEEILPAAAFARRISHGGIYDPRTSKVKWGPFFDNLSRDLTFEISIGDEELFLAGSMSYDGRGPIPTLGIEELEVPSFESYFAGWQHRYLPVNTPLYSGATILPGASHPLIIQYAFGQEPGESGSPFQIILLDDGERVLRYTRDLRRTDISLELQSSLDLIEWAVWEPQSEKIEVIDEDTEAVQVSYQEHIPFYRIAAEKDAPGP